MEVLSQILFGFFVSYGIISFAVSIFEFFKPKLNMKCVIAVTKSDEENIDLFFIRKWVEKIKFRDGYARVIEIDEKKLNEILASPSETDK